MANDGESSGDAAADNIHGGSSLGGSTLPSVNRQSSSSSILPLRRNSSTTSSHSHSSIKSNSRVIGIGIGNNNKNSYSSAIMTTATTTSTSTFPASPALSTLSKNTTSSGNSSLNSSAAAARMSVDDILNSNKLSLGARQKRMRLQGKAMPGNGGAMKPSAAAALSSRQNSRSQAVSVSAASSRRMNMNNASTNNNVRAPAAASSSAKRRLQTTPKQSNAGGQDDRRKRLERLQQQQYQQQQQRLGQQQQQAVAQRSHSLERLIRMDELSKQEGQSKDNQAQQAIMQDDDDQSHSTSGSNKKATRRTEKAEVPLLKTPPRRSKRAKTTTTVAVASYSVKELSKNNVISEEGESNSPLKEALEPSTSTSVSLKSSSLQLAGMPREERAKEKVVRKSEMMVSTMNQQQKQQTQQQQPKEEEEEEEEEPDSAETALTILLTKYDACMNQSASTTEGEEPVSAWKVVQVFTSVLEYINLYDHAPPKNLKLEEGCQHLEEHSHSYSHVERGLAKVLKSVERVKWEVMNRNNNDTANNANGNNNQASSANNNDDEDQEEGNKEQKEAKLLQSIQIQLWIRMMIWSLEQEVGLEFLKRVVDLSDAINSSEANNNNNDNDDDAKDGKKGKKKKGGKKKKKSKKDKMKQQQPTSQSLTPKEGLVADVIALAELAPYVLPPSLDFSHWLKDALTFGYRQSLPDYGTELFDHFEIDTTAEPIVLKRSGTDASHASGRSRLSERSEVSRSPVRVQGTGMEGSVSVVQKGSPTKDMMEKRNMRQRAYFASLAEEEKALSSSNNSVAAAGPADDETATITGSLSTVTSTSRASRNSLREKDDTILFKTSLKLTCASSNRTKNPFLKGSARQEYVGSHLSSKLSNISSLFREVKAAPRVVKVNSGKAKVASNVEKKAGKLISKQPVKMASSTITVRSAAAAKPRGKSTGSAKSRRLLPSSPQQETPRKRPRPAAASSRVAAPLFGDQVEETPVGRKPVPMRLRLRDDDNRNPYRLESIIEGTPTVGNAIVAETPQHHQQQPQQQKQKQKQQEQQFTRSGRPKTSSVRPTTLWSVKDNTGLPPKSGHSSSQSSRQPQKKRKHTNNGYGSGNINDDTTNASSLSGQPTPMSRKYGARSNKGKGKGDRHTMMMTDNNNMEFSLSPVPDREDMASVVAQAAKARAARMKR